MDKELEMFYFSSPIGVLKIVLKNNKLYSLTKSRITKDDINHPFLKHRKKYQFSHTALSVKHWLQQYFSGKCVTTQALKVVLADRGTVFQQKVWHTLQFIPYGKVWTYKDVALKARTPRAMRAVGGACAKNPFLIIVPCHRVVAQHTLGGFALGLRVKKQLLTLEKTL